jgi:hypothetical protein
MTFEEIRQLETSGFAVVTNAVGGPLLSSLQEAAGWMVRRFVDEGYRSDNYWFFNSPDSGEPVLYRIHNLEIECDAPVVSEFYANGPLHALAETILAAPVRPTACAMIVKMPRIAARVPWHRDRTSTAPRTAYNLSLFLDDSIPENGCLEFVPGSHLLPDDADIEQIRARGPIESVPASVGDVLVHDVRVVHSSRTSTSNSYRRSIVIEFLPLGLELTQKDG